MLSWWLRQARPARGSQLLRRLLADELADLLEFGRSGPAAPLEQGRLSRCQCSACRIHAANSDVVIDLASRANGISGYIDIEAFAQKIVHRLTDADVRLDSADEDLPDAAIAPSGEYLAALTAAKSHLCRNRTEQPGQFGCRRPESLRVLLGRGERNAEDFRAIDQPANVPDESGMSRDKRQQFGLHIDNQQCTVVAIHQL